MGITCVRFLTRITSRQYGALEFCPKKALFGRAMSSEFNGAQSEASERLEEAVTLGEQAQGDLDARLAKLSDGVALCDAVLRDLRGLGDVLVKKSLQDVTLPLQK